MASVTGTGVARLAVTMAFLLGSGCGEEAENGARFAPPMGRSDVDRPFVVFSVPNVVIDRLEAPVRAPVTAGSSPSSRTLESDVPAIVSIGTGGELIANRNGRATIRALRGSGSGSKLEVLVQAVSKLEISPADVSLVPGEEAWLVVRGDGAVLSAAAVSWRISDPGAVRLRDGVVRAVGASGSYEVTARYGGASATARIAVAPRAGWKATVEPRLSRVKVGQVVALRVPGSQGFSAIRWESADPRVLLALEGGSFRALMPGRARACAVVAGDKLCSSVEVTP